MQSAIFAIILTSVFYYLYALSITELAARYRTTGGAFDFVRRARGEMPGTVMAILGLLKLILTNVFIIIIIYY